MQQSPYARAVSTILAEMQEDRETHSSQESGEIHAYPTEDGGVLFTRHELPKDEPRDNVPPKEQKVKESKQPYLSYIISSLLLFSMLFVPSAAASTEAPTVTITLIEKVQPVTLSSTLHVGRVVDPITLSQSKTTPTTGHGHQPATRAVGTLTFYNGLFTSQFIPQGTIFTGSDGIQIATSESVTIPANNPPQDGQATIPAHAVNEGTSGNIAAGDITITINNELLVRNSQFHGGQDERDFKAVTQADINILSTMLKTSLQISMQATLESQVHNGESLQPFPFTPTTTTDHRAGDQALTVAVTVSVTCSGVSYDTKTLHDQATKLLSNQALKHLGAGYTLYGDAQIQVTRATINPTLLSFTATGTWVYEVTSQVQEQIKTQVLGKSKQTALQILTSLPGIKRATIDGIDNTTPIPNNGENIHIIVMYAP